MASSNWGKIKWACPKCGKERMISKYAPKKQTFTGECLPCHLLPLHSKQMRERHPLWRGGHSTTAGYLVVSLDRASPYYPMASKQGYVYEHRLLVAQKLGRCLQKSEVVHHLNGVKTDNRESNLCLVDSHNHNTGTLREALQRRIRELETARREPD